MPAAWQAATERDRLRARRVDHAEESEQRETVLDVVHVQVAPAAAGRAERAGQHALALGGQRLDARVPGGAFDRPILAGAALVHAHLQHPLGRALEIDETVSGMVVVQGRHEAVLGLERDHVDARAHLALQPRLQTGFGRRHHQRAFRRVTVDGPVTVIVTQGGVIAQQSRAQQLGKIRLRLQRYRLAGEQQLADRRITHAADLVAASGGHYRLHRHLVARERAGFVGADRRDAAERFDRRQYPNDGVASRHALHANGERNSDDRRQPLRDRRHGQSDRGHEHIHRR